MKTFKTKLLTIAVILCSISASAHDFEVDGIYYNITSSENLTVEVTYEGSSSNSAVYSGSVTIPNSVTYNRNTYSVTAIGERAFYRCTLLTSIIIPDAITNIEESAFYGCTNLVDISLPNSVTNIGNSIFSNCSSLSSVIIGNSLEIIAEKAFYECKDLTKITIGSSVTDIRNSAFEGCTKVKLITCYAITPPLCYPYVFEGINELCALKVPDESISAYKEANVWKDFGVIKTFSGDISSDLLSPIKESYICSFSDYTNDGTVARVEGSLFGCNHFLDLTGGKIATNYGSVDLSDPATFAVTYGGAEADTAKLVEKYGKYGKHINSLRLKNEQDVIAFKPTAGSVIYVFGFGNNKTGTSARIPKFATDAKLKNPLNEAPTADYPKSSIYVYKFVVPTEFDGNTPIYVGSYNGDIYVSFIIVEVGDKLTLIDGIEYANTGNTSMSAITYTRTLNNKEWNALYVPFEIPISQLNDDYELAYINGIHSYDDDNNGEIDRMSMEVVKVKSGTLHANHPYLIKARNEAAKQMSITVNNTTLYAAESMTLDCSSVYTKYEITGIYEKMTGSELAGCYALSGGTWKTIASNSYLNPFRLYLRITSRGNSPIKVSPLAMTRINIHVKGEESSTSVEEMMMQEQLSNDEIIYDLMGRRVENPVKGHIYIVNGMKRVY